MPSKKILLLVCAIIFQLRLSAQQTRLRTAVKNTSETAPNHSEKGISNANDPKPYNEVITKGAEIHTSFFKVIKVNNRYYFEIPDSLLGRSILIVNRIAKAAAEVRSENNGYGGDEIGQNLFEFQKGPQNRLYMIKPMVGERSDNKPDGIYASLNNSNIQPIVGSYPIKAYGVDSITHQKSSVIDVTDQIDNDSELFYFKNGYKSAFQLGGLINDRSNILYIKAFPMNIEIRAVKTYSRLDGAATYELNSSTILLPKNAMKPRFYDERIGYMNSSYKDFSANPQGVKNLSIVNRWRLEPKKGDEKKYLNGELVEPQKPIVIYVDPATPKKWVPYLIAGINDWRPAFEKAGFKNAIIGRVAPKDSTWDIDDAHHSAIVYKASSILNAMASEVVDPRTGEIIETHINWYHNILKLIHDWYMIQAGAIDPRARKMNFDDDLMGQLVRFVSSHEVGHALGLAHNYGASSTVPVDSLRNKKWVEKYGHTPSIMDYARFNYVAQPEDHISEIGIFPRVGDYDKWAIEWGYKWFPDNLSVDKETILLDKLTAKRLNNKRLRFGAETLVDQDPRDQNEDLSDDVVTANTYGIKNLKRILPQILTWTAAPNTDYANAKTVYTELIKQYDQYLWHVARIIGGIYITPKNQDQTGPIYEQVPASTQRAAVKFLIENCFDTPTWLINEKLDEVTGIDPVLEIKNAQILLFSRMAMGFSRMIPKGASSTADKYDLDEFLTNLEKSIFSELDTHQPIDIYRRNLQNCYIDFLINLSKTPRFPQNPLQIWQGLPSNNMSVPDMSSIARGHMASLLAKIGDTQQNTGNLTKYHLQNALFLLETALRNNQR